MPNHRLRRERTARTARGGPPSSSFLVCRPIPSLSGLGMYTKSAPVMPTRQLPPNQRKWSQPPWQYRFPSTMIPTPSTTRPIVRQGSVSAVIGGNVATRA